MALGVLLGRRMGWRKRGEWWKGGRWKGKYKPGGVSKEGGGERHSLRGSRETMLRAQW